MITNLEAGLLCIVVFIVGIAIGQYIRIKVHFEHPFKQRGNNNGQ